MSNHPYHHPYFFLSANAAKNLLQYEYKGIDHSLIYKYILSPLANFLVHKVTPITVAPNTITLMGLLIMFIAYCITAFYYIIPPPSLSSVAFYDNSYNDEDDSSIHFWRMMDSSSTVKRRAIVPNWVFAINAMAMFIYQTLDNMDGKQARKTHSSSPLGLLFDHGCDAINSIFGSQMWIAAMDISVSTHPFSTFICIFCPMTLFFISTWEEYHTHVLVLPVFNGPTEGLLLGICTMLLSFLIHPHTFWHSTSFWDAYVEPTLLHLNIIEKSSSISWTHVDLIMGITLFMTLRETLFKLYYTVWTHPNKMNSSNDNNNDTKDDDSSSQEHTFHTKKGNINNYKILHLIPYFTLVISTWIIGCIDRSLMERNFTLFLHLISALFVEMVTSMMLDHLTKQPYTCFRFILVPYGILTGIVLLLHYGPQQQDLRYIHRILDIYVAMYTTAVIIYLLIKGRIIIHEICMILGIYCFDIVTPRGPDYIAVQAVLSIFHVENHHPITSKNDDVSSSKLLLFMETNHTSCESTGVPSKEKVS